MSTFANLPKLYADDDKARAAIKSALDNAVGDEKSKASRSFNYVAALLSLCGGNERSRIVAYAEEAIADEHADDDNEDPTDLDVFKREWRDTFCVKRAAAVTERSAIPSDQRGKDQPLYGKYKELGAAIVAADNMFRRCMTVAAYLFDVVAQDWKGADNIQFNAKNGSIQAPLNDKGEMAHGSINTWITRADKHFEKRRAENLKIRGVKRKGRKKGNKSGNGKAMDAAQLTATPIADVMSNVAPRITRMMEGGQRTYKMTEAEELAALSVWRAVTDYYPDFQSIVAREKELLAS